MNTKLVAIKDFKSKDGKDHKSGDRLELEEQEAQEAIQRGDAKEDSQGQSGHQPSGQQQSGGQAGQKR